MNSLVQSCLSAIFIGSCLHPRHPHHILQLPQPIPCIHRVKNIVCMIQHATFFELRLWLSVCMLCEWLYVNVNIAILAWGGGREGMKQCHGDGCTKLRLDSVL